MAGEGRKRGHAISEETRRKISQTLSCDYNGMNGYGHEKHAPNGYVMVYAPKHPRAQARGYVMLHTVIMERSLGRYLNENEVAHHINHVRDDNRLSNLKLMDRHEHRSMHMRERHAKRRNALLTA